MAHSGKTMTFATDLVPQEDNIYNLGNSSQRWKIYGDVQPYTTRIYPVLSTTGERSAWYKITFPYYNATTGSAAKWFMNSFDLHFGGGYSSNPSGVAHISFYWTRAANNGAWTLRQGAAHIEGILANKIIFYYRVAEPGILYVCNSANAYNGIWLDNLYVDDTSPSLDWSTTKIETTSAITANTNPALNAYTILPATYLYNDADTLKTDGNFEGKYIKGTWLYTSAATAKTSTAKLATIESDHFIYYITPANALKSAIGTTAIGGDSTPIYWDGSAFTTGTALSDGAYKSILNNTSKGALGWNSAGNTNANNLRLINVNTLAYWNGAYSGTSSNLSVLGTVTTGTWNASVIGAAYGGTGKTTLKDSANVLINALETGSSDLTANDYVITQYVGGGTTTTTYHRRPANKVVNGTLVKAALGTVNTTAKKFLKDTGVWAQVDWGDLTGKPSTFVPSAHEHDYIGKTGFIAYPSDGYLNYSSGSISGYIKIKIPQTKSATMFSFDVDIYNYVESYTTRYHIAGYNYNNASWNACTAYCIAPITNPRANLTVRFWSNGNDEMYVSIGEADTTWSYPKITIHNIALSHSNNTLEKWKSGWTITIDNTSFNDSLVKTTLSNTNIAYKTTAAKLTTTSNAIAYYTDTTGTFGTKASANGALYATSANGALSWGTLPVAQGGTGATTAENARTNLGLGSIATESNDSYMKFGGDDTGLGTHSPAATAKSYWADANKVSDNMITGYYNHSGNEYSFLFSKRATYGTILKWGYADRYLRILRIQGGSWKSTDWEKIDAGYADSAGSVAWTNVSSRPTKISLTGAVTGSVSLSSGDLSIATTVNHTHSYAGSASAGGAANNAVTTANTTDSIYPVGVKSGATTTLLHDTSITMKGGAVSATTYTVDSHVTLQYNSTDSSLEFVFA